MTPWSEMPPNRAYTFLLEGKANQQFPSARLRCGRKLSIESQSLNYVEIRLPATELSNRSPTDLKQKLLKDNTQRSENTFTPLSLFFLFFLYLPVFSHVLVSLFSVHQRHIKIHTGIPLSGSLTKNHTETTPSTASYSIQDR